MTMMVDKIKDALSGIPHTALMVTDDSHHHIGHAGNPDGKGQTHFTVRITSPAFEGQSRLARQRMVNDALKPLFDAGLHSVQIRTFAPGETTP